MKVGLENSVLNDSSRKLTWCNKRSFIIAIQFKFQLKRKIMNFWGSYVVHFKHWDSPYIVYFKRGDCPYFVHSICRTVPTLRHSHFLNQTFWTVFFGVHPFLPLKVWCLQKWGPKHCIWTHFLLQDTFLLTKWGCLQESRAQYVKNWPRYEGFKIEKKTISKFSIFPPTYEKHHPSVIHLSDTLHTICRHHSEIFVTFFFYTFLATCRHLPNNL